MKLPKWNGIESSSSYLFSLACFVVGYVAITALSFGRIQYDDREGRGWSPVSRMPDGKTGLSQFAIGTIGFVLMGVAVAAFIAAALLWKRGWIV